MYFIDIIEKGIIDFSMVPFFVAMMSTDFIGRNVEEKV